MSRLITAISLALLATGCVGIPANVKAVENFDASRYTGTWYEIARLPNSFEKGMEKITADYQPHEDGGLIVVNRGYNPAKNRWSEVKGKACFVDAPSLARLKVSFFGPFYGGYNVIALDENYRWSLVCGSDHSYLWILSRTPKLDQAIVDHLIAQAKASGFDTDKLVFVKHD